MDFGVVDILTRLLDSTIEDGIKKVERTKWDTGMVDLLICCFLAYCTWDHGNIVAFSGTDSIPCSFSSFSFTLH